ncbi:Kef-type K+ transport system membrane component KefB [Ruminococcaceae bacterium R-25]|nr:Kef-type K+ transport system membrane component KefB [Ruminococcaceae bacterium R-25]SUQ21790.1 Kef-type K+ transport system, membrane component KefB [Oscillospiraceae bacterium]
MESLRFIIDVALILFAAKAFGILARKLHAPEVVGEIIAGLILGPAVIGLVNQSDFINKMAEIGVIMLMFEAGLTTDMKKLKATGLKATAIACAGVFVPIVLGAVLFMSFYGFGPIGSEQFIKGLFIGTIMAATSVSITVAALKELGKLSSTVGTTVVSAAIIDDVIVIIVLTFVLSAKGTGSSVWGTMLKAILFFAIAIVSGFVVYKVFKWLDSRYEHTRRIPIAALCYCLFMAYVAERYFGIADITGAYVAGVVLCNLHDVKYVERKVDVSSYMVFAPIFFAGIGLKVSFENFNPTFLFFSIAFVFVALISKIIGCGSTAKLCRFNWKDSLKIGIGMMTRGEVALITAQKGLHAGLITSDYFTAVILMILVSSILAPVLLKILYKEKAAS